MPSSLDGRPSISEALFVRESLLFQCHERRYSNAQAIKSATNPARDLAIRGIVLLFKLSPLCPLQGLASHSSNTISETHKF